MEAIKHRDVLKAEVVAGEERLAGLKAEVTRAASVPRPVPTDVGVAAAEEERGAASWNNSLKRQAILPRTSGVRTRTAHPSHALFGASRIESVVARSTIRSPGNPRIGWSPDLVLQLTSMLSDGAVRMMEMNGGMVPSTHGCSVPNRPRICG